jgi:acetoin utilization protein AcuB
MSAPAISVRKDTHFHAALKLMCERKIRRLPVINEAGWLIGIITEGDLLLALPSPVTALNGWERQFLLDKITVNDILSPRSLVVVHPETTLQEAARLMSQNGIGGMPVVDAQYQLVGVITGTDVFRVLTSLPLPQSNWAAVPMMV